MYHIIRIEHDPKLSAKYAEEIIEFESLNYKLALGEFESRIKNSRVEICDVNELMIYYVLWDTVNNLPVLSTYDKALSNKVIIECEENWYPDGGF